MCRLCAVTATDQDSFVIDVLDRMMLVSEGEGINDDGCGVSNGTELYKSILPYSHTLLGLFNKERFLTAERILLGHVRKASTLTARTRDESHPYEFLIKGSRMLHAAHNGWITPTGTHKHGTPDTDSWRAFNSLVEMLEDSETGDLTSEIMEQWLSQYEDRSQIGLLLLYDGVLHVFRHNKPLHAMAFGNGYLINTSKQVLIVMAAWLFARHGVPMSEPFELPDETHITFHAGNPTFYGQSIDPKYKKCYTYTTTYSSVSYKSGESTTTTTGAAGAAQGTETGAAPAQETAIVPASSLAHVNTTNPLESSTFHRVSTLAESVRAAANPMRGALYLHWLTRSMGILDDTATDNLSFDELLHHVTEEDFELFRNMTGEWSARQADLINVWNRLINKRQDVAMHTSIFGYQWFWLDSFFVSPALSRESALNKLRREIEG